MRFSKLRTAYWVLAVAGALTISAFFAKADEAYRSRQVSHLTMEDLGAFIEDTVFEDAPVSGLEDFLNETPLEAAPELVLPIPDFPVRDAVWVSDGNFKALSASWKRGVVQVAKDKRCKRHVRAFTQTGNSMSPILKEAQAIVESNCDASVVGLAGEIGIFQVMKKTCKEMGVAGDYRDPFINARCAEKLRIAYCKTVKGECPTDRMILAHNRGVTGARKTKHPEATEYLRKLDCAVRVLKGMQCA